MARPLHCNVFTTLSEKQYPLFVIGAKYILNSMPLGVYISKRKLKRSLEKYRNYRKRIIEKSVEIILE